MMAMEELRLSSGMKARAGGKQYLKSEGYELIENGKGNEKNGTRQLRRYEIRAR